MPVTVLGWGRPLSPVWPHHCAVITVQDGSLITACNGRWPLDDQWELYPNDFHLRLADRCVACTRVVHGPHLAALVHCVQHLGTGLDEDNPIPIYDDGGESG